MIEEYSLKLLCDKYGVSKENIVNKNNNILSKGEYEDIDKTLDYLINELKVSKTNIEKCPSILYRNVNAIKDNIDFLKGQEIVKVLYMNTDYQYLKGIENDNVISEIVEEVKKSSLLQARVDRSVKRILKIKNLIMKILKVIFHY